MGELARTAAAEVGAAAFLAPHPQDPSHQRTSSMKNPTKAQVRRRSFELWQQAGFPEGRDNEFEQRASQELRAEEKQRSDPA